MLSWIWNPPNAPNSGQNRAINRRRRAAREVIARSCPNRRARGPGIVANGGETAANGIEPSRPRDFAPAPRPAILPRHAFAAADADASRARDRARAGRRRALHARPLARARRDPPLRRGAGGQDLP